MSMGESAATYKSGREEHRHTWGMGAKHSTPIWMKPEHVVPGHGRSPGRVNLHSGRTGCSLSVPYVGGS